MNITASVQSGSSLLCLHWEVVGGDLPPHTKNYTQCNGEVLYSTLALRNLCFNNGGNYTITAENEYGLQKNVHHFISMQVVSQLLIVLNINSIFVHACIRPSCSVYGARNNY